MRKSTFIFSGKLASALLAVSLLLPPSSLVASPLRSYTMTIQMESATLKTLFGLIEEQFDYTFLIRNNDIDLNERVTFDLKSGSVEDILKNALKNQDADFTVSENRIIVYKTKAKTENAINTENTTLTITQQTTKVSGVVIDAVSGEPIIGANIIVKGSTIGTSTDFDGNFSLETPSGATLVITYIGYLNLEVPASGTKLTIRLKEDTQALEEVVVVAYGTQRKSSITGAISTVNAEKLKTVTSPNVSSMLQGKVAGVSVSQSSGKPGEGANITIRGRGSISSVTTPLWVVDGVVGGLTSDLNPNDIETLTVLKDGSATALYGSRGANGVIMVTTKSAKLGVNRIDVSVKLSSVTATKGSFDVMNSEELYKYTEAAFKNSTTGTAYSWFTPALLENNTNWWDVATKTALSQNYNLSYTTGTEKLKSFLSADYYDEEGTVKGYDYQRFTVRNNLNYTVNDRLSIKTKVSGSYSKTFDQQRSLYSALTYLPWDTPENSLGEIKTGKENANITSGKDMKDYWFGRDASNYLYDLQYNWSSSRRLAVDGTFGLDYKIMDGLNFESTNNVGYKYYMSESYTDPKSQSGLSTNGSVYNYQDYINNIYTNQLLRYTKTFNEVHDLSVFLGYEYTESYTKLNSIKGTNIPVGGEVLGVATTPAEMSGDQYSWKALGYYFNANYAYDDRYLFQFSYRRDGSSKFGRDNRYGNFFTVGGGWNLANEMFLKDSKVINELKLRASFGSTGNTPPGNFSHMGLYQINLNYNTRPAAFPNQMANRAMSWEKAYTTNIGVDTRLFDRLGVSAEFYLKNTSGLLYSATLSALSGYGSRWLNEGKMKNTGVELTLSPEIIKTKDWNWSIDVNLGYNKNKITELAGGKESEVSGNTIREVGYALGTYYMKEWAGVDPLNGTPRWFAIDDDGNKTIVGSEAQATLGRLDKRSLPDFTGGIQTALSYKNFTLSASFAFASGFYIYHSGRQNYDNDGVEIQYNSMKLKKGWSRWENPGDIATHPQVKSGGNNLSNAESSRYLERGDFLKLRNLSFAYTVPNKILQSTGFKSANVGLSAENLFTVTDFSGVDPELGVNGGSVGAGYSIPRRFSISINLGF